MKPFSPEPLEFFGCRREHFELKDALAQRAVEVLTKGKMLQGPEVSTFEAEVSAISGRKHAVCVVSATDALFFSLRALGIGPGDEVLLPDISFFASAAAVLRVGATPVLIDIDQSCNLDLGRATTRITNRTRAILFVQLFGGMSDPHAIEEFAREHKLVVVEDAAQSFGARFGDRRCGGTGNVSVFSFDPTKPISAPGSGGAVLTDDAELATRVRRLRYHGRQNGHYLELGYNSQLPSLAAALLSLKLQKHSYWTDRRRKIADHYYSSFKHLPIEFPCWASSVEHVWHKFTLRTRERNQLAAYLTSAGVPTMIHYPTPFHREPLLNQNATADFEYPVAARHAAETLSLPIHAHLSDSEVERVAHSVASFFH
jgi:dTDP-4-amino-4,6-dideoxygalactose transaminase